MKPARIGQIIQDKFKKDRKSSKGFQSFKREERKQVFFFDDLNCSRAKEDSQIQPLVDYVREVINEGKSLIDSVSCGFYFDNFDNSYV